MGARDAIVKALMGIKAYHGSAADFERFDASKIGTGEGAQAYGHGLYFAGNENVAKAYRDALGLNQRKWLVDDNVVGQYGQNGTALGGAAARLRQVMGEDGVVTPAHIQEARNSLVRTAQNNPGLIRNVQEQLDAMETLAGHKVAQDAGGKMYEVNINADPAQLLNYDQPLRDQPVLNQLPSGFLDATKKEAYVRALAATSKPRADELWSMVKDPTLAPGGFGIQSSRYMRGPEASAQLNEAGIPGIQYLDAGSRSAGTGSSNYVIFPGSADLVDIMRKYGIAAAPAGALGMGALADQSQYEAPP